MKSPADSTQPLGNALRAIDGDGGDQSPTLLFLVTADWYFCSHRLPLARAARAAGYRVVVVTQVDADGERIREADLELVPVAFPRSGRRPWTDLWLLFRLIRILRAVRPDVLHLVSLKPICLGSLAARLAPPRALIGAMTGLGHVFISRTLRARLIRKALMPLLRYGLRRDDGWLIAQNADDRRFLVKAGIATAERSVLIRGSGVDTQRYRPQPEAPGEPLVVLPSRMLWEKGVGEFVAAARELRERGVAARFALVGASDPENPASVTSAQLVAWQAQGVVEWWGHRADMPGVFAQAHVVCLPSYREGLPKALLEAAACGRPLIAADVPGCREICIHERSGLLVAARDPVALVNALERLIGDSELRRRLGCAGRALVEREFSVERVVDETLALYRQALGEG